MSIYTTPENRAALEKIGLKVRETPMMTSPSPSGKIIPYMGIEEDELHRIRGAIATWLMKEHKAQAYFDSIGNDFIVFVDGLCIQEDGAVGPSIAKRFNSIDDANIAAIQALTKETK